MRRAVFFDRDGVLNEAIVKNGKPYPPESVADLVITTGAKESLQQLKEQGFHLFIITNQPDVARKTTTKDSVLAINRALMETLPLEDAFVCYHDDADECHCRKPLPGLLLDAAEKYDIDLQSSFMVGDRWKDIAAGQKALCKTVWINRHYLEKTPSNPDFTCDSLQKAVQWIMDTQAQGGYR